MDARLYCIAQASGGMLADILKKALGSYNISRKVLGASVQH